MGLSYQLDMAREGVTSVLPTGDAPVVIHELDPDEEVLIALGYRQEFKREFTVWSSFCVSFSILGLLPSVAATLGYSLGYLHPWLMLTSRYAGTGGMVWGWIIASVMIQFVAASMAEICSSMPTAVYLACLSLLTEGGSLLRIGCSCPGRMGTVGCCPNLLSISSN
jgi:hypothetical protein